MSTKGYFGEYQVIDDPADTADVAFTRMVLRSRMDDRKTHERARCPGVQVESESIELQQEEGEWRLVSDLVLSYPDPEQVLVEAH
jgi:hypothetical protein